LFGLEPGKLDHAGLFSRQFQVELAKPEGYDTKELVQIFTILKAADMSSSPRELPPQALTEPCVRVSPHTALLIQA